MSFIDDLFKTDTDELDDVEIEESELSEARKAKINKAGLREKLLADILELYFQGKTNHEISMELNIGIAQVYSYLSIANKRFQERNSTQYLAKRAESVAELKNMQRELWVAWNKSKKIDKKILIKRATIRANNPQGQPANQEIEEQVEEMPGNIDYFKGIMWCRAEINRLEGLYAPKKIANTDAEGRTLPTSARDEILRELEIMRERETLLNERRNLEAIEADIVKESTKEVEEIAKVRKPAALLNAVSEKINGERDDI